MNDGVGVFLFVLGCGGAACTGGDSDKADPGQHPGDDGSDGEGTGDDDTASPTDEDCSNEVDDDLDGLVDCADDDCEDAASCVEDCDNGSDDDLDGLVDCEDADCMEAEVCLEDCGNGSDDDFDGLFDCDDPDCEGDEDCPTGPLKWGQVLSGHATLTLEHELVQASPDNYYWVLDVGEVEGWLSVETTSGAIDSCSWSRAAAQFRGTLIYYENQRLDGPLTLYSSSGLATSGACGLSSSEIADLPLNDSLYIWPDEYPNWRRDYPWLPIRHATTYLSARSGAHWYTGSLAASWSATTIIREAYTSSMGGVYSTSFGNPHFYRSYSLTAGDVVTFVAR